MTKETIDPSFDALLRSEFRWPTKGDQPFTTSGQWQNNSSINRYGHGRVVMMTAGYKMAADLMVAHVAQSRHDGDALVFPVIFKYR